MIGPFFYVGFMELLKAWVKGAFDFLHYTAADSGSKIVYGGSAAGGSTSVMVQPQTEQSLSWLLPYVPLIAVSIAFLKLAFDFLKWWVERGEKTAIKTGH